MLESGDRRGCYQNPMLFLFAGQGAIILAMQRKICNTLGR
jgi:hypothetical protein